MNNIDYSIHYKKWHNDSEEHINSMEKYFKDRIYEFLPKNKNIKILDVGCGTGLTMLALKKWGYKNIEGVEIDKKQFESCKKKNLDVKMTDDTIKFLEKRKRKYDLVLALDVLEHIPVKMQINFTTSIYKSLKSKGIFIAIVPNANSVVACRFRYIDWTHKTTFTELSIDFLLRNSGFDTIKIKETGLIKKPKIKEIIKLKSYFKTLIRFLNFKLVRSLR
ncbi:methyltransferase domain-containing protein, partial [Candidatus Dependentiae bacterium]|nr:methyltransferase domain-containing protein [Candidatus Dependentiae bacterium]